MTSKMTKRWRCIICNYETITHCNYERHMISKIHLKAVESKTIDYKFVCECGKKNASKQAHDYHKSVCYFVEKKEVDKMKLTVQSEVPEILLSMKPVSMTDFLDFISIDKTCFGEYDVSEDEAITKVVSLFQSELINVEVKNRPFHNFNEDTNNSVIHFFTEDEGWKFNSIQDITMMNLLYTRYGKPYEYNCFMYFIQKFYDDRLKYFKKNYEIGTKFHATIVETGNTFNKTYLVQELMKMVDYNDYKIQKKIGFIINTVELNLYEKVIDNKMMLKQP